MSLLIDYSHQTWFPSEKTNDQSLRVFIHKQGGQVCNPDFCGSILPGWPAVGCFLGGLLPLDGWFDQGLWEGLALTDTALPTAVVG